MSEKTSRFDDVVQGQGQKSELMKSLAGAVLILLVAVTIALTIKVLYKSYITETYPAADDLRGVMSQSSCHRRQITNHLLSGRPLEQQDVRVVYRRCLLSGDDEPLKAPVLSEKAAEAFAAQRVVLDEQHE